ncbi:MAG TPA: DUF2157 domain-containing protein [Acidobacteriota bacterium]|nr:DUF2157 domain-containing protein [Acidobacteriota bacterium]
MSEPVGKREAQRRVERIHAFREQLAEIAGEGVLELSAEQQSRLDLHLDKTLSELAERYDVDISASQKQISLGMRILSTLGGLAFCAAVFLFFYRYWGLLSTVAQTAILIAVPIAVLVAMQFTARHEKTLYYTALLGLVAFASFIMNMAVLGSIFNITPSQNAFLVWGAFALVLAYTYRFRLLLAAGLICLLVYVAATLTAWSGPYWASCAERPEFFLLPGLAAVLVPMIDGRKHADFHFVYRLIGLVTIFTALEILMHESWMSVLPLGKKPLQAIYQVTAFAAAGATIWLGIRHKFIGIVNLGSAFFALYLFDRLVDWWWNWMPKYLFFLIVGLIAVGLMTVFRRIRSRTLRVQMP